MFTSILSTLLAGAAAAGPPPERASVGQVVPDRTFEVVEGGDGRARLEQFRGQPVLVAFYADVFAGFAAARKVMDLEREHGDDGLATFLMGKKGEDATRLHALQLERLPGATSPILLSEPLGVEYDDTKGPPPKLVLIGVDGTLRYAGSYQLGSELDRMVEEELDRRREGWGEDPLARRARALAFGAGELARARALLSPAPEGETGRAAAEIEQRWEDLKAAVAYHVDRGEPARAARAVEQLRRAAGDDASWSSRAEELARSLDTEALEHEARLEHRLEKLLRPLQKRAPKSGLEKKLERFAEDAQGTRVGARAERLAQAVRYALDQL